MNFIVCLFNIINVIDTITIITNIITDAVGLSCWTTAQLTIVIVIEFWLNCGDVIRMDVILWGVAASVVQQQFPIVNVESYVTVFIFVFIHSRVVILFVDKFDVFVFVAGNVIPWAHPALNNIKINK